MLLCASPFPLQGKTNACSRGSKQDFWRRCLGDLRASQDIPSTHHKLLSLALHYLPFASRFPLPHFTLAILSSLSFRLPLFLYFSCAMAESKRAKGSLHGFNTLDSPSVLSKLTNNDAMERPTGIIHESLNNFDEDDPGIFCYLLMSL